MKLLFIISTLLFITFVMASPVAEAEEGAGGLGALAGIISMLQNRVPAANQAANENAPNDQIQQQIQQISSILSGFRSRNQN